MAFTDNFNRADEDLGTSANWTFLEGSPTTAAAVRSNTLACLATAGQGITYLCPDQGSADQYVQFEIRNVTAAAAPFAICRVAIGDNFIGLRNSGANLDVYKRVGGTFTRLTPSPNGQSLVIGDVIRLEVEGTDTWRAYKNGVLTNTGSIGTSFTSTRQGVICRITPHNPWIDNFEAGPLEAPASNILRRASLVLGMGLCL